MRLLAQGSHQCIVIPVSKPHQVRGREVDRLAQPVSQKVSVIVTQSSRKPGPPKRTDKLPHPQPPNGVTALRRPVNAQLARRIQNSPQRTSRVLNGYDNASERFMDACAQALDMPIDQLFRPEGRNGY
jgi:transcriptional regulator with XRE-family HTH domain